ncbi:MFS transporter [Bifidobacterium aquikefiricola]|uniref:Putative proline/betaine transporter n=1 Tax=Bifidobacterium aquikefiricola TaxID=3059038 RepID=A0AB39U5L6_9BIFI
MANATSITTQPAEVEIGESGVKVDDTVAKKASLASFVGTAMEWYDFYLFSTASALVFGSQFFTGENAWVALMSSFATFAIGFIARPIGGVFFGILGDRVGRKSVLLITVIGIGGVTALIGLLPTEAQIGIWAPTLLATLRFLQGLAVGGEWSGAVTYATEHAPKNQRAWYAVLPQFGSPFGTILSSGAFYMTAALSSNEFFEQWGWRIPFLFAIPLLIIAFYIRKHMEESPVFQKIEDNKEIEKTPLIQVFKLRFPQILIGFFISLVGIGGFYIVTTFFQSYGKTTLGINTDVLLFASMIGALGEALVLWIGGKLGTKYGPSKVAVYGALSAAICAFPIFLMLSTKNTVLIVIAMTLGYMTCSFSYAAQGAMLTALFPANLRLSGVSSATNIGAIFSGFMPLIATALVGSAGGAWWPAAVLLIVISAFTIFGSILTPRLSIRETGIKY